MAKVKLPLLSFTARGSLGKNIVFFPWKGIDCVREYVIPANPKTSSQTTQRGYMTAAMLEFHAAAYNELDLTAFSRLVGAEGKIMTGPNRMVQEHIKEAVAGNTWESIYRVWTENISSSGFRVRFEKASGGNTPTARYGKRKTYLPDTQACSDLGSGYWEADITGLSADTLYYFTLDVGATGDDWGRVGIYAQRTAKA